MIFKDVRLRASRDTPSAFGSTYAKESQLSEDDWIDRASQRTGERSIGYLAMDDGVACGIAAGFLDEHEASRAHLVSMWISPTHRRLGVGRSLVSAIIAWAQTRAVRTLHLMVTSNNESAIRFYESLGFARTGRTEAYPNDVKLIEYEMSRSIG